MDHIISFYASCNPLLFFPGMAFILSILLTSTSIRLLTATGFVDHPKSNHLHSKSIPTGGGIAIIISFLVITFLFIAVNEFKHYIDPLHFDTDMFIQLLLPIGLLTIIGMIDDRYEIKFRYRILLQILISAYCWYIGLSCKMVFNLQLNSTISLIFTTLWIIFFINIFNLIDGIDGLAGGIGFISSIFLGVIFLINNEIDTAVVILIFAASCLGFMRYNFFPAKIFMGDTGSTLIGFMFAVFSIISTSKTATLTSVMVPFLIAIVPTLDGVLAVWRRSGNLILAKAKPGSVYGGVGISSRDMNHIHHRTLDKYKNHYKAVGILYAFTLFFSFIGLSLIIGSQHLGLLILFAAIAILFIVKKIAIIEIKNTILIYKLLIINLYKKYLKFIRKK